MGIWMTHCMWYVATTKSASIEDNWLCTSKDLQSIDKKLRTAVPHGVIKMAIMWVLTSGYHLLNCPARMLQAKSTDCQSFNDKVTNLLKILKKVLKTEYSLANSHQSLNLSNFKILHILVPRDLVRTIVQFLNTETSNAGGYLYIQGMIAFWHKCTTRLVYVRLTLCSGVRTLNAKIESVTCLSSSRLAPEFLMWKSRSFLVLSSTVCCYYGSSQFLSPPGLP